MSRSLALIASAILCGSCASSRGSEPSWVYGVSRSFYSDMPDVSKLPAAKPEQQAGAAVYVCVLLFPFVLETALLPITIPHDLLFVN